MGQLGSNGRLVSPGAGRGDADRAEYPSQYRPNLSGAVGGANPYFSASVF